MKNEENLATKITCVVDIPVRKQIKDLYKSFQKMDGIESISIQDSLEW